MAGAAACAGCGSFNIGATRERRPAPSETLNLAVIGCGVTIGKDTIIRDSIIMNETVIGEGCEIYKGIVAENVTIGDHVKLGFGDEVTNETDPHIYNHGIATVGERSVIPPGVSIGKNIVISGVTTAKDYPGGRLESGKTLIRGGDKR